MKRITTAIILSLLSISLFAESTITTKKGYSFPANEISVTYGRASILGFAGIMGGVLGTAFSAGAAQPEKFATTGSFSAEYFRYLSPVIAVGGSLGGEVITIKYKNSTSDGISPVAYFMPGVKFAWFKRPAVSMYSKLSAGIALSFSSEKVSPIFAFQGTPVCVDFGGKAFRGFAELGVGYQGTALLGLRWLF